MKKTSIFLSIFLLFFSTISLPNFALAIEHIHNEQIKVEETNENIETITLFSENIDGIPFYNSIDEEKEILFLLSNNLEVKLIETYDEYSLIEIVTTEDSIVQGEEDSVVLDESWQGYIENEFILDESNSMDNKEDGVEEDNTSENEENNSEDGDSLESEDNHTESDVEEDVSEIEQDDTTQSENDSSVDNSNEETQANEEQKATDDFEAPMSVVTFSSSSKLLTGVVKKSPTNIREKTSTKAKIVKKYPIGSVINYKKYNDDWFILSDNSGFIHKKHVTTVTTSPKNVTGVAKKKVTNVRTGASTKAKIMKKLSIGEVVQLKTFSKNWYSYTNPTNGQTGYIHRKHVTIVNTVPKPHTGVAKKSPTNVRAGASTNAKVMKKLPIGEVVDLKSFSKNWYSYTVNGQTGYIHKKHVTIVNTIPKTEKVVALKSPTNVRTGASTKSKVLTKIKFGTPLTVKTFSKNWYSYTTNGNTGYIHRKHVDKNAIKTTKYNLTLNQAVNIQLQKDPRTSGLSTMYVDKKALKKDKNGKWVITGNEWDVKSSPNSTSKTLGKIKVNVTKDPITVDEKGSTKQYYKFYIPWIIANKEDTISQLNPNNFSENSNEYFQFLVLSQPAGTNYNELNKKILTSEKGILAGKGGSFIRASRDHKINELYLISHAMLETGNGSSKLAKGIEVGTNSEGNPELVTKTNKSKLKNIKTVYNMYGIGAIDGAANKEGAIRAYKEGWTSIEKAINGGAKFVANQYIASGGNRYTGQDTLYKMRWHPEGMEKLGSNSYHQYATDIKWATKQTTNLKKYYDLLEQYNLVFDVPSYK